ncbi:hypothetical protein F889_02191 [Acinetobacter colistiniresistens]|uniref:Uncharacterized protein n=1 Tax=Acinetobacter colistiniresistens TaxID=280145 RepID=N9R4J2_9GAMM|nr:hypothetical protein [Acinetobacter colistiniresistens]ENX33530.1 hypothetical protein F889_02191 [Acinetobacter colistiniresistens]
MAKHIELVNTNGNIIIDDQYTVPMLLWRGFVKATDYIRVDSSSLFSEIHRQYTLYDWSGRVRFHEGDDASGMPFDSSDYSLPANRERSASFIVAVRQKDGYACTGGAAAGLDTATGKFFVQAYVYCEANVDVEVCIYTPLKLRPSKHTVAVYNAAGDLIYDVMKPPLHFLGGLHGGVDARNNPAAQYNVNLPPNIESQHVFITSNSAMPFYAAYRITSNNIQFASTNYKAVMTFPSSSQAQVTLWRMSTVGGNNNSISTNTFFENLIYCPYPLGKYF